MSDIPEQPASADTVQAEGPDRPNRRVIFRDLLIFQVKLWLDGLKDIVLSPLSIIGFGIDVVFGSAMKGSVFYKVLKLGERYDLWLNLFGAAEKAEERRGGFLDPRAEDDRASLDDILRKHAPGPTPAAKVRNDGSDPASDRPKAPPQVDVEPVSPDEPPYGENGRSPESPEAEAPAGMERRMPSD
jgi:hypothetical protein